jgi:hypothetical protein
MESKVLRNRYHVIREGVNIYKCLKCEGTFGGKQSLICPDKNCRGTLKFWKRIPQSKVEEITSRRAARQCPKCMRYFYAWIETCPYCDGTPTIKGKITKRNDPLRKYFDFRFLK